MFSLPGKVDSKTSFGTNGLIKQGAKLVSCAEDILEEFNLSLNTKNAKIEPEKESITRHDLAGEELLLYNLIPQDPLQLDDLVEKVDINISRVSQILLNLQLKKLIREIPGKQFVRS